MEIVLRFARWLLETQLQGSSDSLTLLRAERLRDVLIDLGPAFVKIGQAFSARPDVVPPIYLAELQKLQDQIPPFDNADAMAIITEELGQPPEALFDQLSPATVAAASLGQVYKGRLRSSGEVVAIKVQRPGVAAAIGLDTYILRNLAAAVKRWRKLNTNLPALIDEWATSLFKELDYRNEAQNGVRFKKLYGEMQGVYVPAMNEQLTTRRVLVMEWVTGERLRSGRRDAAGAGGAAGRADDLALVDVGVRCSLEQMLELGFYHADPHPGNLLRTADGRLCYLDFGMMGEIDANIRRGLIRATLHMTNREYSALTDDFITLGFLPQGSDRKEVEGALTQVFQAAMAGGVSNLSFGDLSGNLGTTMYQYQFKIPPYYTLLVRSLSVLEGIALGSDPGYKVLRAAYPWVARRLLTDRSPELKDTLLALLYKDGQFQFTRMESLLREATRAPGAGRSASGGSARVSGAAAGDALALLLSPAGEVLREVVTEEVAKGMDAAGRLSADAAVAAARQQAGRLGIGGGLADALRALPALSDADDMVQVQGLQQLAAVLQENSRAGAVGDVRMADSLAQAAQLVQWLAAEAQHLDAEQRREAARIPLLLATKLTSRVAARAVRLLLNSPLFVEQSTSNSVTRARAPDAEVRSGASTAAVARQAATAREETDVFGPSTGAAPEALAAATGDSRRIAGSLPTLQAGMTARTSVQALAPALGMQQPHALQQQMRGSSSISDALLP